MTYYISQDEDIIKNDLKARKFIIQKERPADTKFFDTEIACFKSNNGQYTGVTAVVIFKVGGKMVSLGYMTLKEPDFVKKLNEVRSRGFALDIEDTTQYWIFRKDDTLVTGEKRVIDIEGKILVRYEVCVAVQKMPTQVNSFFVSPKRITKFRQ